MGLAGCTVYTKRSECVEVVLAISTRVVRLRAQAEVKAEASSRLEPTAAPDIRNGLTRSHVTRKGIPVTADKGNFLSSLKTRVVKCWEG